jgi:hypothetical protein
MSWYSGSAGCLAFGRDDLNEGERGDGRSAAPRNGEPG